MMNFHELVSRGQLIAGILTNQGHRDYALGPTKLAIAVESDICAYHRHRPVQLVQRIQ